ncbi:MAG: hypothetical protein ACLFUY_03215 [Desulfobacterales bacterium]
MYTHPFPNMDALFLEKALEQYRRHISPEGLRTCERIEEVMMLCARETPVYEQISSFAVALYTIGYFDCPDLMAVADIDSAEAGRILQEDFIRVAAEDIPLEYRIMESDERYMLVAGDPLFPVHFAVLADCRSNRPFFSKLPFFGSGFDSLTELIDEFAGIDGVGPEDFCYFRIKAGGGIPADAMGKIYILK